MVLAGAPLHATVPAVEALVRWDPAWFAERELDERRGLSLPPAVRVATLTGRRALVEAGVRELDLPAAAAVLGPLPHGGDDTWRTVLTVPAEQGLDLARELAALRARASARKESHLLTVRVDPPDPTA